MRVHRLVTAHSSSISMLVSWPQGLLLRTVIELFEFHRNASHGRVIGTCFLSLRSWQCLNRYIGGATAHMRAPHVSHRNVVCNA